jgi:hypothetical protein
MKTEKSIDHWGGKRLSQLLALFVAIALTPSMLLAEDEDHINGRDKAHDPTGAWLIRGDAKGSPFILTVFHKGGTLTGDLQGESAFDPAAVNPPTPPNNVINSPESGRMAKDRLEHVCGHVSDDGVPGPS